MTTDAGDEVSAVVDSTRQKDSEDLRGTMRTITGLAVGVVLAGAAVGFAGSAAAEEMTGTYVYTTPSGGHAGHWVFSPCGPNCATVHMQEGSQWTANANFSGGRWHLIVDDPQGMNCGTPMNPGEWVPMRREYSWDPVTLQGTDTVINPTGGCGKPVGETYTNPFSLVKA